MNGQPRTLVISPNWIGDAVMAQPLLALLKERQPERPIDILTPPSVAPVWHAMAEVSEVLETPFRHRALQLSERWKYARVLRRRGYADAYVLPNTIKYALIPWLAGVPRRVGYKGEMRYGLVNVMHHDDAGGRSMVPFYAALANDPDQPPPTGLARPRLCVNEDQVAGVCGRVGIGAGRTLVVFAPGAEYGAAKRWPPRYFGELARAISEAEPKAQLALLGSPKDRATCDEVVAHAGEAGRYILNLAGQTRLPEAVAIIARSTAVVSNDSGLLHIAAALNRKVIGLYGSTNPDYAPPLAEVARSLSLRLACSPCRQRECPLGHHNCMEQMGAEIVWRELQPMLR
jgi:heptosyltransferase-2